MSKAQRAIAPGVITDLKSWLARWPKASNIGFDPQTREPTVYSADGSGKKVLTIPWRRELDVITVLSQTGTYPAQYVSMAKRRYGDVAEQQKELVDGLEQQQADAESLVLEAWEAYREAPPAMRGTLMSAVISAEKALAAIEEQLGKQLEMSGGFYEDKENEVIRQYIPPMPFSQRGIPISGTTTAATGGVLGGIVEALTSSANTEEETSGQNIEAGKQ